MDDCIFCKLANGVIPTETAYENDYVRVIADANPANVGHLLVITKKHAANLTELDEETAAEVMKAVRKTVIAMKQALNPDGINVIQNNGEAAGQTVMHFHMHVIPRYFGDGILPTWRQLHPVQPETHAAVTAIASALQEQK